MFCPYGIQAPSVLGNGDTIKENDGLPRRTLSTIWLHELMHLWTITIPGRTTDGEWEKFLPEIPSAANPLLISQLAIKELPRGKWTPQLKAKNARLMDLLRPLSLQGFCQEKQETMPTPMHCSRR